MFESIKEFMPNIHKEGYFFISIFVIITIILFSWSQALGFVGMLLTVWCIFFFRDPERVVPVQENVLVSPADGIVQEIVKASLPKEIADTDEKMTRVSIFLSIFNVHVNRIPISGKVKKLHYHYGKFLNASFNKASEDNERQSILITTKSGENITFVQIAGLIARRIVCTLKEEQTVKAGERFGIIRFGSRVDVYLPAHIDVEVLKGQTMVGGETIIAKLNNDNGVKQLPRNTKKASNNKRTIAKKASVKGKN